MNRPVALCLGATAGLVVVLAARRIRVKVYCDEESTETRRTLPSAAEVKDFAAAAARTVATETAAQLPSAALATLVSHGSALLLSKIRTDGASFLLRPHRLHRLAFAAAMDAASLQRLVVEVVGQVRSLCFMRLLLHAAQYTGPCFVPSFTCREDYSPSFPADCLGRAEGRGTQAHEFDAGTPVCRLRATPGQCAGLQQAFQGALHRCSSRILCP